VRRLCGSVGQHQARLHSFGLDPTDQRRRHNTLPCELSCELDTTVEQRVEVSVGLDAEDRVDGDSRDQQGGCQHDEYENRDPAAQ